MVYSFRSGGLRLGNTQIGRILGLNQSNTSRMIAKLEAAGWLRITAKQSRWRCIYFASSDKVNNVLLCSKEGFTLLLGATYFAPSGKQNISNKRREENSPSTFAEKPIETPQETPDPTQVKRVLASLGFLSESGAING